MEATQKELTYDQYLKLIKENGNNIENVPVKMVDQKMVDLARKHYARVGVIPEKFVTLEMVLDDADYWSVSRAKDFAYKYLKDEWGISVSAFAALAVNGIIPNMKKVPLSIRHEIEIACFKKAFNRKAEVVFDMSDEVLNELKKEENFIKDAYTGSYSRSSSKFGRDRWIGDTTLRLFAEEDFTDEDIEFIMSDIEKRLDNRNSEVNLSVVPRFLISDKAQEEWIKKSGTNLQYVPEDERTLDLCKIAVEQTGNALRYVPEDLKKEFYLEAVKKGGLSSIPKEDRTDRICTIAVVNNAEEIKNVPEDKRTYAICLMAVDANAEMLEFVPQENRDREMIIRFLISVLSKRYQYDFSLNRSAHKENKESIMTDAFFSVIDREQSSSKIMSEKRNLIKEAIKREPSVFPTLVKKSKDDNGWPTLYGVVDTDICIEAFKGNKDNVGSIPLDIVSRMVSGYIDLTEKI